MQPDSDDNGSWYGPEDSVNQAENYRPEVQHVKRYPKSLRARAERTASYLKREVLGLRSTTVLSFGVYKVRVSARFRTAHCRGVNP